MQILPAVELGIRRHVLRAGVCRRGIVKMNVRLRKLKTKIIALRKPACIFLGLPVLLSGCNSRTDSQIDGRVSYGQRKFIVGGEDVRSGDPVEASTVVLLNGSGKMRCSGTLIAPRLVVSAAHCFVDPGLDNSNLSIGFGLKTESLTTRTVKRFSAHSSYDPDRPLGETAPLFDIALVELNEDAPAGSRPARVPDSTFVLNSGEPLALAGFGLNYTSGTGSDRTGGGAGTLRRVNLPLGQVLPASKQLKISSNNSQAVCSGDSGGPAYALSNPEGLVVTGVTSWGYSRCENGLSVFTDIRQYTDWIVGNGAGLLSRDQILGGSGSPPADDSSRQPVPPPYTTVAGSAFALLDDIRQGRISQAVGEVKDRNAGKYTRSLLLLFRNSEPKYYCIHIKADGIPFDGSWGEKRGPYKVFGQVRISDLPNFDAFGCSWQSSKSTMYWYLDI